MKMQLLLMMRRKKDVCAVVARGKPAGQDDIDVHRLSVMILI